MNHLPALRIHRLANELSEVLDPEGSRVAMELVAKHLDTGLHRVGVMCAQDDCRHIFGGDYTCPTHGYSRFEPRRLLIAFDPLP